YATSSSAATMPRGTSCTITRCRSQPRSRSSRSEWGSVSDSACSPPLVATQSGGPPWPAGSPRAWSARSPRTPGPCSWSWRDSRSAASSPPCRGGRRGAPSARPVSAGAAEHDLVLGHAQRHLLAEPADRALELVVRERHHLAALVADEVVVMLGLLAYALEANHRLAGLHALDEPDPLELVENPVH